jgi:hypothetical protein
VQMITEECRQGGEELYADSLRYLLNFGYVEKEVYAQLSSEVAARHHYRAYGPVCKYVHSIWSSKWKAPFHFGYGQAPTEIPVSTRHLLRKAGNRLRAV